MMSHSFNFFLIIMSVVAVVVFVALYFVDAGYGKFISKKWGPSIDNKLGWFLMESPVFIAMLLLWLGSDLRDDMVRVVMLVIFEIHYFQRSFIFPFLIRGKNKMPILIILMGVIFNTLNALMQGGWIFYVSPDNYYTPQWLVSPQFICGVLIFAIGMSVNMHSDKVIRNLRKPGDTKHYLPQGGMFKYVTSANYFGELLEWSGFAILTWSWSGAVFVLWTFANLAPRAARIYDRYKKEFGNQMPANIKRIIPFIY
ncbi:MAG: DUF1295 domain-containing protein [Bacteroidales bacterium]|nr:DUF1295 domain-containing protein [Bacteroidales bacterium]